MAGWPSAARMTSSSALAGSTSAYGRRGNHDLHPARGVGRAAGRLRFRAQPPDVARPADADHRAGPGLRPVPPGRGLGRGPGRGHPRRTRAHPRPRLHRHGAAGRKSRAAGPGRAGETGPDRARAAHARARHRGLWREYVSEVTSQAAPETMTEGAPATFTDYDTGHDPADPVDQAIMATRKAVFPLHGLMP